MIGDAKKVGYYAGLMVRHLNLTVRKSNLDFFLFQDAIRQLVALVTVMFWSRMSDHIGRKPILLLGTLALAVSNLFLGLSRTFWALTVR